MKLRINRTNYLLDQLDNHKVANPNLFPLIDFLHQLSLEQKAFIFNTSGSTGSPKKIEVTLDQIKSSVTATQKYVGLSSTETALICLDPNFVASKMMAARAFYIGMTLIIEAPNSNPLQAIDKTIDFASFVPFQIYQMIEFGNINKLEKIRNVLIGGAPLSPSAFELLTQLKTNIFITYGMTETVSHIALMKVEGDYSNTRFRLMKGIDIDSDSDQCLKIKGAVTQNKWIQTNDIVEITNLTSFKWLGRRDDVINSGGIKIHPELIERAVSSQLKKEQIEINFFISSMPHSELGHECILLTEGKEIPEELFKAIQAVITLNFTKFHMPKKAFVIHSFLKTESGKLKRKATTDLLLNTL